MITIEIENTKLETRSGVSSRTQKEYTIREQHALLFKDGERFPDKIKINIKDGASAYTPGVYALSDSSFYVSRFGGLEVSPVLVAYSAPAKQATA